MVINLFGVTLSLVYRQEHIGISTLETGPKGTVTSTTSKAEALNKAFKSVFTIEDLNSLPSLPDSTHH